MKVMVLGAGVYQLPLIKKVKELGYKAVVVSPVGNYPGLEFADYIVDCDTRDKETILAAAIEHQIEGILTTGTDVAVPSIGYVVDKLKLPGTGYEASRRSMDKALMKECFIKNNVSTAKYKEVYSLVEAVEAAELIGYPVMVKAVDSSGSRGITKVEKESQIQPAFNEALFVSQEDSVIIEQFISGYEIGAQVLISGDKVDKVFLHNDTVTQPPISVPIGHSLPVILPEKIVSECIKTIELAVESIGLSNTVANVDLMISDSGVFILEIGARMGATCLPENISIFQGVDIYEYLIGLAIGKRITLDEKIIKQPNASLLICGNKTGIVDNIVIPSIVENHPSLIELKLDVEIGDRVNEFKVGPDRLGHVIVVSETKDIAEKLAEELVSKIEISIK